MAIIKCKMCGGDLMLSEDSSIATCEYCGSVQTIPKADDEKKLTLFARANRLRIGCEFDKAAGIYEAIVADFPEEAEAYWGLVLCKFGIEYVDDPATGKKIPTCHRSSFDSIMDDSDFEQAMENADSAARKVYREEAKAIEEIRKGIIAVSSNEEPYDIFICYKETAEDGQRTLDSVLAQDVYDALTEKGYRVFFSRITLEDKLGVEYEPYIFAALNSAKVMLTFGTDYEYLNAVWVKNEWSRFLKLMASDKEKHLIPCYKGIDAYDMPKEFAKLQAQDLGKVGATQDLLRGIEKILPRQTETVKETVVVQQTVATPGTVPLLKRMFLFLEDGNWDSADEYAEKVLDMDPECAKAYLGKLLADLRVKTQGELCNQAELFDGNVNYQKALRFADSEVRGILESGLAAINQRKEEKRKKAEEERIAREKREEEERIALEKAREEQLALRKQFRYNLAIKLLEQGEKAKAYGCLRKLSGYKDADALLETIRKDIYAILAPVKQNGKWGCINEAGKMVIPPQFNSGHGWGIVFGSNGLACVKQNGKWGYINEFVEMVIPPQFEEAECFDSNGLARVQLNGKYGYINEAGKMVIPPQFDYAASFASNGLAYVEQNGKYGYINEAGKMVIPPQFEDAVSFASNGLAPVKQNGKWGYINEAGEMVIPPEFDSEYGWGMGFGSNGLACVKQNGKWGYINEAGKMVIPPQFEDAYSFGSNGLAPVQQNGKWGCINEIGEMVISPQFEDAVSFASNGLALVKQNGKYGYINEIGEMVIPPQFQNAWKFDIIFHSELEQVKRIQEKAAEEKRIAVAKRRAAGLCQHCGGQLKGLFSKKCVSCGKPKDY